MDKVHLSLGFAQRLKEALITQGLSSSRSASGVSIPQLATLLQCSPQICRRYLKGEALPEPLKLAELAKKLQVSAGWLLFGDRQETRKEDHLFIDKTVLHALFQLIPTIPSSLWQNEELATFLVELVRDVSILHKDKEQSKKIISLALSSLTQWR